LSAADYVTGTKIGEAAMIGPILRRRRRFAAEGGDAGFENMGNLRSP
jgi:hypothetical protein